MIGGQDTLISVRFRPLRPTRMTQAAGRRRPPINSRWPSHDRGARGERRDRDTMPWGGEARCRPQAAQLHRSSAPGRRQAGRGSRKQGLAQAMCRDQARTQRHRCRPDSGAAVPIFKSKAQRGARYRRPCGGRRSFAAAQSAVQRTKCIRAVSTRELRRRRRNQKCMIGE